VNFSNWIIPVTIYFIIPIIGIAFYIKLYRKIGDEGVPHPPDIAMVIVFATYGGLLLAILTALFWKVSGMAVLGLIFLTFGAPVIMGLFAAGLYKDRRLSIYHYYTWLASVLYFVIYPSIIGIGFLIDRVL
jgi:hypothetical protein